MKPFLTRSSLPQRLHRNAIADLRPPPGRRRIWALYALLTPLARVEREDHAAGPEDHLVGVVAASPAKAVLVGAPRPFEIGDAERDRARPLPRGSLPRAAGSPPQPIL